MTEIGAAGGQPASPGHQRELKVIQTKPKVAAKTAQVPQAPKSTVEAPIETVKSENVNGVEQKNEAESQRPVESKDVSEGAEDADQSQDVKTESEVSGPAVATSTPTKRRRPAKKAKRPTKILKLKIENKEPAPEFVPVEHQGSSECFWLRLLIREYLLRFEKLCRFSARYLGVLNDLSRSWPDPVYKAVLVSLLRVFSLDKSWLIPQVKQLLPQIEGTSADSSHLWTLVADFLYQFDPYLHNAEQLDGEQYRLELVRRVLVLTTSTESVRSCISEDQERIQQLRKTSADNIKQLQTQHAASLEKMKKENKQVVFNEKKKAADKASLERVFKEEQSLFVKLRKLSLRSAPVGTDNFSNSYWILQQKGKDTWGPAVLCEMKVLPEDEDQMVVVEKEPELDENGKPKKVRRKYIVAKKDYLSDRQPTLYVVSGQNLAVLAGWIRGQIGQRNEELAVNLETLAYYCPE